MNKREREKKTTEAIETSYIFINTQIQKKNKKNCKYSKKILIYVLLLSLIVNKISKNKN